MNDARSLPFPLERKRRNVFERDLSFWYCSAWSGGLMEVPIMLFICPVCNRTRERVMTDATIRPRAA